MRTGQATALDELVERYVVVAADAATDVDRPIVATAGRALVSVLADEIYTSIHARSTSSVVGTADDAEESAEAARFLAPIRAALGHASFRDEGWTVLSVARRLVTKNGLVLHVPRPATGRDPLSAATEPMTIAVDLPCERRRVVRGCYVRHGKRGPHQGAGNRVYVHAAADTANMVFADICRKLDGLGIKYTAKIFNSAFRCRRADPIVVELTNDPLGPVLDLLSEITADRIEPSIPGFCKAIRSGIGIAELDLLDNRRFPELSFGQQRSLMAARGLVEAFERGATGIGDRRAVLHAEYQRYGLTPAELWRAASDEGER